MHISTKCSVAIHCLVFICEYGESKKVTSELLSLFHWRESCNHTEYRQCIKKGRHSLCQVWHWWYDA